LLRISANSNRTLPSSRGGILDERLTSALTPMTLAIVPDEGDILKNSANIQVINSMINNSTEIIVLMSEAFTRVNRAAATYNNCL
jgi:hypothetical protein